VIGGPHLHVPLASAPVEEHADWLELVAIGSSDCCGSYHNLTTALRYSGTADAISESVDDDEDSLASIADGVFCELDDRLCACGGRAGTYPFSIEDQHITLRDAPQDYPYVFLLLLSHFGKEANPEGLFGERIFEEVCAKASESYFGGPDPDVCSRAFGFPRKAFPSGFREAVNALCTELGEGAGAKDRPRARDQKDAKLDVVTWKHFPDRRSGKLIAFGQCATGRAWQDKRSELNAHAWSSHWMRESPIPIPLKLFFVPHRVSLDDWDLTGRHAGIIFDRCRIAHHATSLDSPLGSECAKWCLHVMQDKLGMSLRRTRKRAGRV